MMKNNAHTAAAVDKAGLVNSIRDLTTVAAREAFRLPVDVAVKEVLKKAHGIPPYVAEGIVRGMSLALPRIISAHEAKVRGTGQKLMPSIGPGGHLVYEIDDARKQGPSSIYAEGQRTTDFSDDMYFGGITRPVVAVQESSAPSSLPAVDFSCHLIDFNGPLIDFSDGDAQTIIVPSASEPRCLLDDDLLDDNCALQVYDRCCAKDKQAYS